MNIFNQWLAHVVLAGAALSAFTTHAEVKPAAFGEVWQSQGTPSNEQAQIVYYRSEATTGKEAALVYVDGEFQAALLPGMFTRFCVKPGEHSLGAYQHDAPRYQGKTDQLFRAAVKGGKTYFIRVDAVNDGRPQPVSRSEAERELQSIRLQKHALSRASSVVACDFTAKPVVDYVLSSDVLFAFGRSGQSDIQPAGRKALEKLAAKLNSAQSQGNKIEVIGHTDTIGSDESNLQLGQQRAESVATLLKSMGIAAQNLSVRSVGSAEPLVLCKSGSREEQIQCNAPNRRVIVRVETQR